MQRALDAWEQTSLVLACQISMFELHDTMHDVIMYFKKLWPIIKLANMLVFFSRNARSGISDWHVVDRQRRRGG